MILRHPTHRHTPEVRKSGFWADLPCRGHSWWGCSHQVVCSDCGTVLMQSLREDCPERPDSNYIRAVEAVRAGMAYMEGHYVR